MILSDASETKKVALSLIGLDGNAFNLLGQFQRAARRQGWTDAEIRNVFDDATSGDYDHLVSVLIQRTKIPDDED